ncbi:MULTISPECIES: catalase [unclassified Mameliella]|uniref:catalase n=1 Tax=unclassified Mameliella TaxID=2630630 RepID=UPI00273F860A|nr:MULTISPECIES: catalase [unclassified Mameliella]
MGDEHVPAGEAAEILRLTRANLQTLSRRDGVVKRGQHAKHHALLQGRFRVRSDLPQALAQGVFQPGADHACLVRFSNGGQQDDRALDVRGMAIKLLGIPGMKLQPGQGHLREQDFVLVDHPVYFCKDMADYMPFNRHFLPVQALRSKGCSPLRLMRALRGLVMLGLFHRRVLRAARAFAGRRPGSLLALTYHSTTPYRLGDLAVKYRVQGQGAPADPVQCANGLGRRLWQALGADEARMTFGVVIQDDPERQPVDDARVDWDAAGAVFEPLAEIVLPRQENSADRIAQAEALRFSPWMSLPAHRPLGAINRARREVYRVMAEARGADN